MEIDDRANMLAKLAELKHQERQCMMKSMQGVSKEVFSNMKNAKNQSNAVHASLSEKQDSRVYINAKGVLLRSVGVQAESNDFIEISKETNHPDQCLKDFSCQIELDVEETYKKRVDASSKLADSYSSYKLADIQKKYQDSVSASRMVTADSQVLLK